MRIIAGTARSLPLKTIEGMDTRPTTDRIKETLFNMIQNDVPGSYFLDLFAGSGQIGLEAVSRGARYAVFVENNKKACTCIEDNIHFTKFDRETKLLQHSKTSFSYSCLYGGSMKMTSNLYFPSMLRMAEMVFVENNKKACTCIEDNIHFTKFDRETKLLQSDVIYQQ